ncbi:Uncharacterised protein [Serratia rubidaea]|uniref:Uncharacterized protein n=1 Tax=Serratia rubidaea TaxID=61652 RepID=A0A3S4I5I7_SERRU|nr:Uncharacterised protein [Serratia rubidaea]
MLILCNLSARDAAFAADALPLDGRCCSWAITSM